MATLCRHTLRCNWLRVTAGWQGQSGEEYLAVEAGMRDAECGHVRHEQPAMALNVRWGRFAGPSLVIDDENAAQSAPRFPVTTQFNPCRSDPATRLVNAAG